MYASHNLSIFKVWSGDFPLCASTRHRQKRISCSVAAAVGCMNPFPIARRTIEAMLFMRVYALAVAVAAITVVCWPGTSAAVPFVPAADGDVLEQLPVS